MTKRNPPIIQMGNSETPILCKINKQIIEHVLSK